MQNANELMMQHSEVVAVVILSKHVKYASLAGELMS